MFDELYGVESISQVYGILTDWVGEARPRHIKKILYDDACQLAPFAKKGARAVYSKSTSIVSGLDFYIDKMHFKGHVSKKCHDNYNPYSCQELSKVNSQVCEQTFNFFNKFTQVKAMNHYRFRLFFVYMIDLHNLKLCNQLNLSHPKITEPFSKVDKTDEDVCSALKNLQINQDLQEVAAKKEISCPYCRKTDFGSKSGLTRHINTIHQNEKTGSEFKCDQCKKACKNQSGLTRHKSIHNKEKKMQ